MTLPKRSSPSCFSHKILGLWLCVLSSLLHTSPWGLVWFWRQLVSASWFFFHFYVRGTVSLLWHSGMNLLDVLLRLRSKASSFSGGLVFPLVLLGAATRRAWSLCCCPFSWASTWSQPKETRPQPQPESDHPTDLRPESKVDVWY